jgi:hypothetical protein
MRAIKASLLQRGNGRARLAVAYPTALAIGAAVVLSLLPAFGTASAAEPSGDALTNPPPILSVEVKHEEGPDIMPAERAWLTIGTNKCAFIVPPGFRMNMFEPGRVSLASADYSCLITLRVLAGLPAEGGELTAACRDLVFGQYPGAKILEEFGVNADNRSGPGFDLEWPAATNLVRRVRAGFVPFRGGVLEFALNSSREAFETGRQRLNTVLLTFRASDVSGRLEVMPLSNRL